MDWTKRILNKSWSIYIIKQLKTISPFAFMYSYKGIIFNSIYLMIGVVLSQINNI